MDKKKRLRKKADKMLQEWVRKTYKHCLLCNKPCTCGHHFFHRANSLALRYFKPNLIPICSSCHLLIHAQGDPYVGKIMIKMGEEWFHNLWEERKREVRDNIKFYEEIIKNL